MLTFKFLLCLFCASDKLQVHGIPAPSFPVQIKDIFIHSNKNSICAAHVTSGPGSPTHVRHNISALTSPLFQPSAETQTCKLVCKFKVHLAAISSHLSLVYSQHGYSHVVEPRILWELIKVYPQVRDTGI